MFKTSFRTEIFLFFVLATFLGLGVLSCKRTEQRVNYVRGDMGHVFKLAKLQNKKVFVVVTDSSCEKCKSFLNFLDDQNETVKLLTEEYICYKVDIRNKDEKAFAELVKCPSYPFPYFFDNSGNLLAFGYPNSKDYDISDLNKIGISEDRFSELFQIDCTIPSYKSMVSQSLKGTLLMKAKRFPEALVSFNSSLQSGVYPYNLRYTRILLKRAKQNQLNVDAFTHKYKPSTSDLFLYGNIFSYIDYKEPAQPKAQTLVEEGISFDSKVKDLGVLKSGNHYSFEFILKNKNKKPLVIYSVNHPCDCIKLSWSKAPIPQNERTVIKGEYTPNSSGGFAKEIFVHTNLTKKPMDIIKIIGTIQ
jgi:hypothetical protein